MIPVRGSRPAGYTRQSQLCFPTFVVHAALFLAQVPLPSFCIDTSHTTLITSSPDQNKGGDFIQINNDPEHVVDNYNLSIEYFCSNPCVVGVEVLASSELKTAVHIFRKRWKHVQPFRITRTRTVQLRFPSVMVYREDFFIRHSIIVQSVMLRAWIVHSHNYSHSNGYRDGYQQAVNKTYSILKSLPPYQRPFKKHNKCLQWGAKLMWRLTENRINQCPHETDAVEILSFPHACTGERYGVVKTFYSFNNSDFEKTRIQQVGDPRFTLSIWMYFLNSCKHASCAIVHHISPNSTYGTPLVLLTETGDITIQARCVSGQDSAFRAHVKLSMRRWHRLDLSVDRTMVTFTVVSLEDMKETVQTFRYQFVNRLHYDDTAGYFILGGSKYMPSIEGFYGPVKYYRLEARQGNAIVNPLSPKRTVEELDIHYQRCEDVKRITPGFLQILKQNRPVQENRTCKSYYVHLKNTYGEQSVCEGLPWTHEKQRKYQRLFDLLQMMGPDLLSGSGGSEMTLEFGKKVFEMVSERLSEWEGEHVLSTLVPSLQISSCCGYHRASYYLAVVYETGLGVPVNYLQGHVYGLIGAQGDESLALMHLGYKHIQGIDGYPLDYDLSYSYYINIGKQTLQDRWKVQETQAYVESVRLTDETALKFHTNENSDLYQFLNLQAKRGDLDSQKTLARMLFWGQNGVSKNVTAAAKWYARSALEMEDPQAMYDLAIILFKGQGVKKNKTFALQLMKKAAEKGSVQALNGLGWYYHTFKADLVTATKYFEKAAQNESSAAFFNLGIFYLNGLYPGKSGHNQTAAFELFLKAAVDGHFDAVIECSQFYATGQLSTVSRDPEMAAKMAKEISEQNGNLGYVVKMALDAYMERSWNEAFLHYLVAAEAGMEVAQSNIAYMCEEWPELGQSYFRTDDCEWRYYNRLVNQHFPPNQAYLKMGDYFYYGLKNHSRNIKFSIAMYANAASADDSQAFFNLASLVEEGHHIPKRILKHLQIDRAVWSDNLTVALKLYERCRYDDPEELISPCSLAWFRVQLQIIWKRIMNDPIQSSVAYVVGTIFFTALVTFWVHRIIYETGANTTVRPQITVSSSDVADTHETEPLNPGIQEADERAWWFSLLWSRVIQTSLQTHPSIGDWSITLLGICVCSMCVVVMMHLL
ncbi:hypothetical protein AOXY_G3046 [Acipenser oxyrinchus oxyrinchus]|uniref:Uncharacterized protein n=1 Tax=Acipenser oxyrinchus oxyrinchus TaxID=40147 RepID=A0AAD8GIP7_ACIOX|nr:hypothetical protein AOXY_G3046 [Acipenser oxyrinchus oxyrinchus]